VLPPPASTNKQLGDRGEERAARWYRQQGYTVVARNWRDRSGEIDLVCTRAGVLVVCEVKTRRTDRLGAPVEAVTVSKQRRLRRLAAAYLRASPGGFDEIRFDVVSILGPTLTVVQGAF
jgi:putative endonuclease